MLDGNNISYRVAIIATTTTNWLQEQHMLAASSLSFISCRPKATTNGKEEISARYIASRDGDDDDDLSCHVAPMAATIAFGVTQTYHFALISYCITRWRQQQQSGCSNNICWQHASHPSYRFAQKQRRTARKWARDILHRAMVTTTSHAMAVVLMAATITFHVTQWRQRPHHVQVHSVAQRRQLIISYRAAMMMTICAPRDGDDNKTTAVTTTLLPAQ
jgi:hypothetical protein